MRWAPTVRDVRCRVARTRNASQVACNPHGLLPGGAFRATMILSGTGWGVLATRVIAMMAKNNEARALTRIR